MDQKIEIINDVDGALSIMRDTAEWCEEKCHCKKGQGSWQKEKITLAHFQKKLGAKDDEYAVFTLDGKPIGACILQKWDSAGAWRKYGLDGRHYYIHRFCVAKDCHGKGMPRIMLDAIKEKTVRDGFKSIRLEADMKVYKMYINAGFFPHWTFVGGKTKRKFVRLAWYQWTEAELDTIWRGAGRFNLRWFIYRLVKRMLWFL